MAIGIDLGTTKSVIGVWKNQEPYIIPDDSGYQSIPSLVLVTHEEEIFAGRAAQKHPERYKSKNITINSVKRMMGRKGETGWAWWKTYPQEVSAFILSELKNNAEKFLGQEVTEAVIAIPSHFDESQRRATKEAAEIAGLKVLRLLNEATAAAMNYGFHQDKEREILVFDFGGGTLDVSIVSQFGQIYKVRSIAGDSNLGGDDFNQIIINYVLDSLRKKYGTEIELDPLQKMILQEGAETAKIELSSLLSTSIYIPGFLCINKNYQDLNISIDRKIFEEMGKNLLDRAIGVIKQAMSDTCLKPSELSIFLLLGGSSQIPCVKERIKENFGSVPLAEINDVTWVARGATIQSGILAGKLDRKEILLMDAMPSSYGIGLKRNIFKKLIERNTTVPTRRSEIFTTTEDNQSEISTMIYQGERVMASDNTLLGKLELKNIEPSKAGVPQIEVTFDVDANMIVHASARNLAGGKPQDMVISSPYGLNSAQVRSMQQKLKLISLMQRNVSRKKSFVLEIDKLLLKGTTILDWSESSALRKRKELLNRIIGKNNLPSEELMSDLFSSTEYLCLQTQEKISNYEKISIEIKSLIEKIEKFTPILGQSNQENAILLNQGKNLLNEYIERGFSCQELKKIFTPIQLSYEEIKANFIANKMRMLITSNQIEFLILAVRNTSPNSSLLKRHLNDLRKTEEISSMLSLLESDDIEYQTVIRQIIFQKLQDDPYISACFVFIVSVFVDIQALAMIKSSSISEKGEHLLNLTPLVCLVNTDYIEQKRNVAQNISKYLFGKQYISTIANCIAEETDSIVKNYLFDYLNNQSSNELYESFKNFDYKIKEKIASNREILLKLLNESDEKDCLTLLEFLARFPLRETTPKIILLAKNKNIDIRTKALELLTKTEVKSQEVLEIFRDAFHDLYPQIRLIALEFADKNRGYSFIPAVIDLLRAEQNESVKEKAVTFLGSQKDISAIQYLFNLLLDKSPRIRNVTLLLIENNSKLLEQDFNRFISLIKKMTTEKHSLGLRDKYFLRTFQKRHPDMINIIESLRKSNFNIGS